MIQTLNDTRQKFVGICFGHQVIAIATGGKVIQNPLGWEVGPTKIDLDLDLVAKLLGPLYSKPKIIINEMHRDHVVEIGGGFSVLGSTSKSPFQLLLKPNKYLTIQGHPELTIDYTLELVSKRVETGVFPKSIVGQLEQGEVMDSLWFANLMMNFLSSA